jgi:TolB-like protein/Flp pilus assembly protein TadD
MSGDPEQEYFSDGLTDILITELAKVPGIFVIARQSTDIYKKKRVTIRQVAEELGVQYVLEGSVQKAGDSVRINSQLIDALKGHHLWAERYDRPLKDAFAVQDEIARKAVTAIKGEVQWRLPAQEATTAEGFDYFSRGFAHHNRVTKEDTALARQMFEKAVELEPQWPTAWALLAGTHRVDFLFRWSKDPRRSLERSAELAKKALALDDAHPGANANLGSTYLYQKEHEKAIAYGRKSVAFSPNSSSLKVLLAQTLNYSGQPEEAVELVQRAMRLNPRYPGWWLYQLGQGYRLSGQYDKAIAALKEAVVRIPKLPRPRLWLAIAYSQTGEIDKARDQVEKVLELRPKFSAKVYARVNPYKNPADLKRDLDALRKAGLPENPPLPLPKKPSIAVLPFTNMSGDPEQEYFSDGITEDIITDLSKLPTLLVIARNSTFVYKGKSVDIRQVARKLRVRYVLEGSFRKAGQKVRITAQLVDGTTGHHAWVERYDREFKDIFALQDDITQKVVTAMEVKLTEGEQARIARRQTDNVEAYLYYRRGVERMRRYTKLDNAEARQLLEKAVELDPNFGAGWALLATTHYIAARFRWSENPAQDRARAEKLAQKALTIDESDSGAYRVLNILFLDKRKYEKAIAYGEKSVALAPNHAFNTATLAMTLRYAGRPEEALGLVKRAIRLSPNPPVFFLRVLGDTYRTMGRY